MLRIDCGFEGANTAPLQLIHYGPEITVDVGFDETWRSTSTNSRPTPGASALKALVDTGAQETYIDSDLAEQLRLPHVDQRPARSAGGWVDVDYFRAQIYIPSLRLTLLGPFAALPLIKTEFKFHALLGRTFLHYVKLQYDGPTGACEISRT
jgi:predicted aspartyl protease